MIWQIKCYLGIQSLFHGLFGFCLGLHIHFLLAIRLSVKCKWNLNCNLLHFCSWLLLSICQMHLGNEYCVHYFMGPVKRPQFIIQEKLPSYTDRHSVGCVRYETVETYKCPPCLSGKGLNNKSPFLSLYQRSRIIRKWHLPITYRELLAQPTFEWASFQLL